MVFPQFCGPSYKSLSPAVTIDDSINLYSEKIESGSGKSPYALYGAPGIQPFVTVDGGAIRGLAEVTGNLGNVIIAVAGDNVWAIDDNANPVFLGNVANDRLPATIVALTNDTAFILSAGLGYIATLSTLSVVPVALPAFAGSFTYLDTYGIISEYGTNKFYVSDVGDLTTWDPLNVATKEAAADPIIAVFAASELLWIFGLETTEIWYDAGNVGVPFQRYPGGGVLEVGCTSPWSIQWNGQSIQWLGRDSRGLGVVWAATGMQPVRVSNHAVEAAINERTGRGLTELIAYSYLEDGHFFYVLNTAISPLIDITWVYDATTGQWHKRGVWDGASYHRQPWMHHCFAFDVSDSTGHYVGGNGSGTDTSGTIYLQEMNIYDFAGSPKRVERTCPHLDQELRRLRYDRFRLDLEKTSNPILNLRFSVDGGESFGNTHTITAPDGQARAIWRELGSARDMVFKIWSDSPCLQAWAAAYIDVTPEAP